MLLFLLMLLFLCINIIFDFSGMEGLGLFWLSGQGENVGVETPSIFTVLHMEKIMKVLEFSTGGNQSVSTMQGHATSNVHDYVQDFFDVKKKITNIKNWVTGRGLSGY